MSQSFVGEKFIKCVSFSKAVLWKDRVISLNIGVIKSIQQRGTKTIQFMDVKKNERWDISVRSFLANAVLKQYFQEKQYYINISHFKRSPIKKISEPVVSKIETPLQNSLFV